MPAQGGGARGRGQRARMSSTRSRRAGLGLGGGKGERPGRPASLPPCLASPRCWPRPQRRGLPTWISPAAAPTPAPHGCEVPPHRWGSGQGRDCRGGCFHNGGRGRAWREGARGWRVGSLFHVHHGFFQVLPHSPLVLQLSVQPTRHLPELLLMPPCLVRTLLLPTAQLALPLLLESPHSSLIRPRHLQHPLGKGEAGSPKAPRPPSRTPPLPLTGED